MDSMILRLTMSNGLVSKEHAHCGHLLVSAPTTDVHELQISCEQHDSLDVLIASTLKHMIHLMDWHRSG